MANADTLDAVKAAFALAGYDGDLRVLATDPDGEVIFVLPEEELLALDGRDWLLERVLARLLGRTVFVLSSIGDETVPFA